MSATMVNRDISKGNASSTAIAFPAATLLSQAERLAKIEREVIAHLPDQDLDEVLSTRANAKLLSETAWRIECACDAQIVSGAKSMRGKGRNGEAKELGVTAAVRKQAKKAGCTPATVFKNAQIFKLIQQAESASPEMSTALRVLNERKYFVVALTAADPVGALKIFIEKKSTLPRFRTTDAERLLSRLGITKKQVNQTVITNVRKTISHLSTREEEIDHIYKVIELIKLSVIPECSNPEIIRLHESYIEDLTDHLTEDLFNADAAAALRRAWSLGNHNDKQLAKATGFPEDVVHREMKMLERAGQFLLIPRTEPPKWHKIGEPVPPELGGKR